MAGLWVVHSRVRLVMREWQGLDSSIRSTDGRGGSGKRGAGTNGILSVQEPAHSLRVWPGPKLTGAVGGQLCPKQSRCISVWAMSHVRCLAPHSDVLQAERRDWSAVWVSGLKGKKKTRWNMFSQSLGLYFNEAVRQDTWWKLKKLPIYSHDPLSISLYKEVFSFTQTAAQPQGV